MYSVFRPTFLCFSNAVWDQIQLTQICTLYRSVRCAAAYCEFGLFASNANMKLNICKTLALFLPLAIICIGKSLCNPTYVDLTYPVRDNQPRWPGAKPFKLTNVKKGRVDLGEGEGFYVEINEFFTVSTSSKSIWNFIALNLRSKMGI